MATRQKAPRRLKHPYITRKKGVCGGKPIITGTRIKVSQIVIYYDRLGFSPDQIVQTHPHLSLAAVHDALSYYYDNAEQINQQILAERRMVDDMKRGFVSILEQKRRS